MIKLHRVLLAATLLAMTTSTSMAGYLGAGSLSGSASDVEIIPPGTLTGTSVAKPNFNLDPGVGSLAAFLGGSTGVITVDPADLGTFSFTSGLLSFTAGSPYSSQLITLGNSRFLAVSITGTVNYNGDIAKGLLSLTFTQSGPSARVGGGLSLEVIPIPEPSSVALAGIGLAAAGLFGLRKRLAK